MSDSYLRYTDDSDRAYGVAGMSVAMVLWEGEPYLASVSIDSPVGESIQFTPAFGFNGNPRMTASIAWREMQSRFELSAAMIMGNVMCRSYVQRSQPLSNNVAAQLRAIIRDEASEKCSLDSDEADLVYNKVYRYLDRVFTHSGVSSITAGLADTLMQRRTLTGGEIIEILSALNRM